MPPALAFGKFDGDQQMLEYTAAARSSLALIVHPIDAARKWVYDRKSQVGKLVTALNQALAKGWIVIDMNADWRTIFPPEK
jgi:hypothetical protein